MSELERSLPSSPESERLVLGAVILEPELLDRARVELLPDQLYVSSHRRIFEAMIAIAERSDPFDEVVLAEELDRQHALESVGGPAFISNLIYGLPRGAVSIAHHAKIIRGKASLRQLIKLASKITNEALEQDDEPESIIASAESSLFDLGMQTRTASKSTTRTYEQVAASVMDTFEQWGNGEEVAIPTGIPELDRKLALGGFAGGDVIVIAARTSFGKSALALQIALNALRCGTPVLYFSLEMKAERLFIRNLASVTGVAHNQISPWTFRHNRQLSSRIMDGISKLAPLPIKVEDRVFSLNRLCSIARDWHRRLTRPGLIVTDYMQLVSNKLDKRSREQEVAGISLEFKRLAGELNVPLIGISQFSRQQTNQNRRPEVSDLRESGQIENDCDVALFPWSTETLEDKPIRGMKLYCPKQRNGAVGWELDIDFDAEHQWFYTEQMYRDAQGITEQPSLGGQVI